MGDQQWTGGYAIMQGDGTFVGYDMWGHSTWATNTGGAGGNCNLVVQNDANLVLHCGGKAKWDRYHGRLYYKHSADLIIQIRTGA
jgi:hypothetical protein